MLDIIGFVITSVGTLAGLFSVFYAYRAANRSDALLRRLVVYPFRELDIAYARLNDEERKVLISTFESGAPPVGTEQPLLDFLIQEGWTTRSTKGAYKIDADRIPYLTFMTDVQGGDRPK